MDLSSFHQQFREEVAENVRVLHEGLLSLETISDANERRATLDRIFRAMHTIKGSARVLGFEAVSRLAHALEDVLSELRRGQRTLDRALTDALLRGGDAVLDLSTAAIEGRAPPVEVESLIETLLPARAADPSPSTPPATPAAPPTGAPAPAQPEPPTPASTQAAPNPLTQQTIRVRVDRLDRMLNLAGELVVEQQLLADHINGLRTLQTAAERQMKALEQLEAELGRLRFSPVQRQALDQRLAALRTATVDIGQLAQRQLERFSFHAGQHELLVRDLEHEVMEARLLPIGTVFASLPRAVRDLTRLTGKQVHLEIQGEAVELDRKVLEMIADPLVHLIRNAVDHGIETVAERQAVGKPPQGRITVRAVTAGAEVRVTVADDGRGIDPQRLREHAQRLGIISAEAAAHVPDHEALDLIFMPGFSTANVVTDISGRGVGMDVVRQNLAAVGGRVEVESQPGQGTQVTMILPLTLITTRVLLVQAGKSRFALPASGCGGVVWIHQSQIQTLEGQPTFEHEGRTVTVFVLADLLGFATAPPFGAGGRAPAVLVGSAQRQVALLVDALLDEREVVVKPLGTLLASQRRYGGAVQLGDGSLALLVNPMHLIQGARVMALPTPAPPARTRRLLVVDDSFTTRELIRSILQSAGYEVVVAVDGVNALEILRAGGIDLVVSDIEMPRMNGFELVASLRAEQQFQDLPVVLVTGLASEEHRRRGLEVGAQAYIVKSQFDQENLLEVIQRLLGGER